MVTTIGIALIIIILLLITYRERYVVTSDDYELPKNARNSVEPTILIPDYFRQHILWRRILLYQYDTQTAAIEFKLDPEGQVRLYIFGFSHNHYHKLNSPIVLAINELVSNKHYTVSVGDGSTYEFKVNPGEVYDIIRYSEESTLPVEYVGR